ncbi:MAG: UDP-glucose 4-epimerase [Bradymonadia bacterium]|jgi:UDP-glucose 4-epimerase
MKTLIIGRRSNLSAALHNALPDAELVASASVLDRTMVVPDEPFRVVINAFQPATMLRDYSEPLAYCQRGIGVTARVLEDLRGTAVERVVYTSSASVYGDNIHCSETDPARPADLHASLKLANEHLVRNVCRTLEVPHTVARVFNMVGGDDRFSVVSKIAGAVRDKNEMTLVNNGNAIRDFIHIDDVVAGFVAVLNGSEFETINIASGRGTSVGQMVDSVRRAGHEIQTRSISRKEIKVSTANVERLSTLVDTNGFTRIEDHLLSLLSA